MKFTIEKTDEKNAPKPKQTVATIPDLAAALASLPKGSNFLVPTAGKEAIDAGIIRVHVQRAGKSRTDVKFVTRLEKDKGLRIYAV